MSSVSLRNRTIWITGASTGIGKSLAEALIARGNRVIVTSRREESLLSLKSLAPDRVDIVAADVSKPDSVLSMRSELDKLTNSIDTVILNAGTCEYLDTNQFDSALFDRVIQVNFVGLARCIEASIHLLQNSALSPHIVGISSAAAITGLPRAEAYGASKAAVESCLESLALDLDAQGVDVSIVYPGFVDTPLTRKNDFPMPFLMSSDQAVIEMIKGIEARKFRIAFPKRLIWSLKLMAMLPDKLRHRLGLSMVRDNA
ncbi:MAG: SDR family NAD(P)-dependent oxidoreductase [Acidiferrobacterales bacterium]|nr:SDR family NAD(P)-dependent oxidoreductase [Acidiferrobacterales bacterium]